MIHTIKSKHVGLQTMQPSAANETPIKIIKTNLNARKLSMSNVDVDDDDDDDVQTATEIINRSIEKSIKMYT